MPIWVQTIIIHSMILFKIIFTSAIISSSQTWIFINNQLHKNSFKFNLASTFYFFTFSLYSLLVAIFHFYFFFSTFCQTFFFPFNSLLHFSFSHFLFSIFFIFFSHFLFFLFFNLYIIFHYLLSFLFSFSFKYFYLVSLFSFLFLSII